MATLTSVNKEHLDNILNRIKTIEWRKKPLPLGKHYGYETKNKGGCGKVTGEFEVVENIKFNLHGDTYRPQWLAKGCVPFEFLVKYANGAEYLYANIIERAKRYDSPKELSEFFHYCGDNPKCDGCEAHYYSNTECGKEDYCCSIIEGCKPLKRPPQSWCYVEELKEK
jgi:predicted transcriptional regulator